jgi:membrane-associated phospholipid phosphatase
MSVAVRHHDVSGAAASIGGQGGGALARLFSRGRKDHLTAAMKTLSFLGSVEWLLPLTILLVLFFAVVRRHEMAALWIVAMTGALLLDVILKHSFHRSRPAPFFGTSPQSCSFPSGHALASPCLYSLLARNIWVKTARAWIRAFTVSTAVLLVASIGLSRVYLGVHYPTDVLAGYLAAALWVGTGVLVESHLYPTPASVHASGIHGQDRNAIGL